MKKLIIFITAVSLSMSVLAQSLDKVAVIVDQGVILESEIQALIGNVKRNATEQGQTLPSDRALRVQAIERLIIQNLQLQRAQQVGIQISDAQLDATIENIAKGQGATLLQLRASLISDGISYDKYREDVRNELITGEVTRGSVRRRVNITPQEVDNLVELIDEQGAEQVEYRLSHILIAFPPDPTQDEVNQARTNADRVIKLLENGSDFVRIAIASSSGANNLEGGDMGWMNINSMPTLFAEAVDSHSKDDLIGPIRSGAGFHILKIADIRGLEIVEVEEVNARHILIQPSVILSDNRAENMLKEFREQVINGEADFAELAKEHSADPGSALRGGELGWTDPEVYVPEFKNALAELEPGEYSQPVRSVHGWHLMQLIDRRQGDVTEKRKQDKAAQLIFQRKYAEEQENWLRELRDGAYIEVVEESQNDITG